ncbi:MAG: hypothetical protein ACYCS7_04975 [Acidimicrobiales bacterium]
MLGDGKAEVALPDLSVEVINSVTPSSGKASQEVVGAGVVILAGGGPGVIRAGRASRRKSSIQVL